MALTAPSDAIYPKKHIKSVRVIYDGTKAPFNEFSIAELELHNGDKAIGIRHDRNEWNENNEENGYPVVRGGLPSWFIMPEISQVLPVLNQLFGTQGTERP
jgi:hypothetical protein